MLARTLHPCPVWGPAGGGVHMLVPHLGHERTLLAAPPVMQHHAHADHVMARGEGRVAEEVPVSHLHASRRMHARCGATPARQLACWHGHMGACRWAALAYAGGRARMHPCVHASPARLHAPRQALLPHVARRLLMQRGQVVRGSAQVRVGGRDGAAQRALRRAARRGVVVAGTAQKTQLLRPVTV